jgi:hypothetical protein
MGKKMHIEIINHAIEDDKLYILHQENDMFYINVIHKFGYRYEYHNNGKFCRIENPKNAKNVQAALLYCGGGVAPGGHAFFEIKEALDKFSDLIIGDYYRKYRRYTEGG